ncbi:hypothetical protein Hanom_Chr13g01209501 [Helianthus anomalus]
MKFFFIREEVIPIAMIFRESDKIDKEELSIPKVDDWYMRLLATPNRIFGEQVLVVAAMSDKWPERSEDIPLLMFNGEAAQLYQAAFPTFGGSKGVRPLEAVKVYWYEQIKGNFLYPPAGVFANPPTATEGAQLPKPRPLRGVTSAGKEILFLSSEESVGSSQEELSSWSNIFAGVLRNMGIDPEERPKKAPAKKKPLKKTVTLDTGATSKKTGGSRTTTAAPEKEKEERRGWFKKFWERRVQVPESGATLSSVYEEEEEEEVEEEEVVKLVTRKRSREEIAAGLHPRKKLLWAQRQGSRVGCAPFISSHQAEKTVEEPAGDVIPEKEKVKETEIAATTKQDMAQGPKVVRITGLNQP